MTTADLLVIHLQPVALPVQVGKADDFDVVRNRFLENRAADANSDSTLGAFCSHDSPSFDWRRQSTI
jgi:hypothetical protein